MLSRFFLFESEDKAKLLSLLGIVAFVYLCGMFNHHLIPSMEPRFAEVITEMLASNQYLVPIKNGWPYVEYPPLYYWLSLGGKVIGLSTEAAIRLPAYLALLLWLLWLTRLQNLLGEKWPVYAYALLGVSFPGVLYQFFTAQSDSVLVLGVLIAFAGFIRFRTVASKRKFPWELWLGVSLATTAKGPVGIACTLPIMFLELFIAGYLEQRDNRPSPGALIKSSIVSVMTMYWFRGLGLLLLVNLPWYIATGQIYGWEFIQAVVIYQNFDRYLTGFSHIHPWWYYLVTMSYDVFPASILMPFGIYFALRKVSIFKYRLALLWAVFTIVFFSISASKQGKYILPAAPSFIMLAFVVLEHISFKNWKGKWSSAQIWKYLRYWAVGIFAVWAITVVAVLPFYSHKIGAVEAHEQIRQQLAQSPGKVVSFQWPRSETLYYLGAPLDFVRSSRELYQRFKDGKIVPGDYVLVKKSYIASSPSDRNPDHLVPAPAPPYMELTLDLKTSRLQLYRVLPGVETLPLPETPEPPPVFWRDKMFDTD